MSVDLPQSLRRDIRAGGVFSECYMLSAGFHNGIEDKDSFQHNFLDSIFQKLLNTYEYGANTQIDGIYEFEQLFNRFPPKKLIKFLTTDIMTLICSYAFDDNLRLSISALKLLVFFAENAKIHSTQISEVYQFFVETNFFTELVQKVKQVSDGKDYQETITSLFIKTALQLMGATVKRFDESALYFIEIGITETLFSLNQTKFINQLLFLYSSFLMISPSSFTTVSEDCFLSLVGAVVNYLGYSDLAIVSNSLNFLQICLTNTQNNDIWKHLIFEPKLCTLLSIYNSSIISSTITTYSMICNFGIDPLYCLFENQIILDKIFTFIQNFLRHNGNNAGANNIDFCCQCFNADENVIGSILDFIINIILCASKNNYEHEKLIYVFNKLYLVLVQMNFPLTYYFYSFDNEVKILQIVLDFCKLSSNFDQVNSFLTNEFFDFVDQIAKSDFETENYCMKSLALVANKFSWNNDFLQKVNDLLENWEFS